MNFLKKGPELKIPDKVPDVKVPDFLTDIYHELRERHLLPLVVVLIAGVIAVPIALSESAEPVTTPAEVTEAGVSASKKTEVVVAKSEPGLRDYRKRLDHLTEKNPFKQQFAGAQGSTEATSGEEGGSVTTSEGSEATGGTGGAGYQPPETAPDNPGLTYYTFKIDARITHVSTNGKPSKSKPEVRKGLPELTMLPNRETPAIIFMGVTKDSHKALMLVSSNVNALFGDNVCAVGGETCQLLAMEPNVPETFVYGGNEKVYKIELLAVKLKRTDNLDVAPLGKPHGGDSAQNGGTSSPTR